MKNWLAILAAVSLCGAVPCAAEEASIKLETERPYYDRTIGSIALQAENVTGHEYAFGDGCILELRNGSIWVPAQRSSDPDGEKVQGWSAGLPAGERHTVPVALGQYAQPLADGVYRIGKRFTVSEPEDGAPPEVAVSYAEFQVVEPLALLEDAQEIRLRTALGPNRTMIAGDVTLARGDRYGAEEMFQTVWHELAVFQPMKGGYNGALSAPALTATVTGGKGAKTELAIYQGDGRTYAKAAGQWYAIADGGLVERLLHDIRQSGGYLPKTGEALIEKLKGKTAFRDAVFEAHTFSTPFAYSGWLAKFQPEGSQLAIYAFPDGPSVNRQLRNVCQTIGHGLSTLTLPDEKGEFTKEVTYDWTYPAHYFQCGRFLLLYNGEDAEKLAALEAAVGREFDYTTSVVWCD